MSKFVFTDEVMYVNEDGHELTPCTPMLPFAPKVSTDKVQVLHRIKAVRNIDRYKVKVGDLGGFVSKQGNVLSQTGDCWVGKRAKALRGSRIEDDALISSNAVIRNWSVVRQSSLVSGTVVLDNTIVEDSAVLGGEGHAPFIGMRFGRDMQVLFPGDIITIRGIGSGLDISFVRAKSGISIYSVHRKTQVRRLYEVEALLDASKRISGVWLSEDDRTLLEANLTALRGIWK